MVINERSCHCKRGELLGPRLIIAVGHVKRGFRVPWRLLPCSCGMMQVGPDRYPTEAYETLWGEGRLDKRLVLRCACTGVCDVVARRSGNQEATYLGICSR